MALGAVSGTRPSGGPDSQLGLGGLRGSRRTRASQGVLLEQSGGPFRTRERAGGFAICRRAPQHPGQVFYRTARVSVPLDSAGPCRGPRRVPPAGGTGRSAAIRALRGGRLRADLVHALVRRNGPQYLFGAGASRRGIAARLVDRGSRDDTRPMGPL